MSEKNDKTENIKEQISELNELQLPRRPFGASLLSAFTLAAFIIGIIIGPSTKYGYDEFGLFMIDDIAFYYLVPALILASITLLVNKRYSVTPLDRLIPKVIVVISLLLLIGRAFSSGFSVVD